MNFIFQCKFNALYDFSVDISRVNIDDPCKCDSVDDLTDDQNSFHTRFTSAVTKEELHAILVNQTYCRYHEENEKWRWVHPHEFCNLQGSAMKNRNIGIFNWLS